MLHVYLDGAVTFVAQSQARVLPLKSAYCPQFRISLTLTDGALQMLKCLELSWQCGKSQRSKQKPSCKENHSLSK